MSEVSNAQREAIISLMAEVWDDFVSDTGCFPDDFTILPRRRLQFVAGRWAGMVADALYGPNGPIATALAEAEARGGRQGLEEALAIAKATRKDYRPVLSKSRYQAHEIQQFFGGGCGLVAEDIQAAIDALATAPAETQKPETGESDHG